jgi:hypothetical protein
MSNLYRVAVTMNTSFSNLEFRPQKMGHSINDIWFSKLTAIISFNMEKRRYFCEALAGFVHINATCCHASKC